MSDWKCLTLVSRKILGSFPNYPERSRIRSWRGFKGPFGRLHRGSLPDLRSLSRREKGPLGRASKPDLPSEGRGPTGLKLALGADFPGKRTEWSGRHNSGKSSKIYAKRQDMAAIGTIVPGIP